MHVVECYSFHFNCCINSPHVVRHREASPFEIIKIFLDALVLNAQSPCYFLGTSFSQMFIITGRS